MQLATLRVGLDEHDEEQGYRSITVYAGKRLGCVIGRLYLHELYSIVTTSAASPFNIVRSRAAVVVYSAEPRVVLPNGGPKPKHIER